MDLSNYETDIVAATKGLPEDVMSLYEKSEVILKRLMQTKALMGNEDGLNELPKQTLELTKECVPVLQEIEDKVGASHQLYVLQSAKLYNIITHSSDFWSKALIVGIRSKRLIGTSTAEMQRASTNFATAYKELAKIKFQGANKTEYEQMCKKTFVNELAKPTDNSGCLGVFIFLLGLSGGLLYWLIG